MKKIREESSDVSKKEFDELKSSVSDLVGLVKEMAKTKVDTPETPTEKEVKLATFDNNPVNPEWERMAKEIIGEPLDHCEVAYPKRGGVLFTIVIKTEMSNAPKDYLERMKVDRRTREIGNEGQEGVEAWCRLVASNLKNARKFISPKD
jgi:hypothetical protein